MVSPARKRDAAKALMVDYRLSNRRACRLVGQHRSALFYVSKLRERNEALRKRLRELAASRPRYGYRRLHTLLRREGFPDSIERVYRFYRAEGLQMRQKARKKRKAVARVVPERPTRPNERWAMDFVHDRFADCCRARSLKVEQADWIMGITPRAGVHAKRDARGAAGGWGALGDGAGVGVGL